MSKKFPTAKAVRFVLCEDVREEARQKLSYLGVFPADSITVIGPSVTQNGAGVAQIASIAIVITLKDLEGSFESRFRIKAPDGATVFDEGMGKVELTKRGTATLAWKAQPFVVPKFGRFEAELLLDGRPYPFEFEILDGSATAAKPIPKERKRGDV
jgi:hypothetical protein